MLLRLANIKAFCNTTSGWETEGSVSILVLIWCNGIYFPIWMLLLVILGHNWHCWVEGGRKIADSRQNKYRIEPRINCTHPKYSDQWTYDISSLRATQSISSEYHLQNLSEGFIWVRNIWAILPIKETRCTSTNHNLLLYLPCVIRMSIWCEKYDYASLISDNKYRVGANFLLFF